MNEIKRKKYESPLTEMARVQLEDGICAASSEITNPGPESVGSDFSEGSGWDTDPTTTTTK